MKNFILMILICFSLTVPIDSARAAIDPKAKAFMVISTYGTVGGALLGFASMSFGSNPRAIAQGASLGLYAGIIFGAYVLTSYNQRGGPEPTYNNGSYPPEENGFYPSDNGYYSDPTSPPPAAPGAPAPQEDAGGFFGSGRVQSINTTDYRILNNKKGRITPPVYINLLKMRF